MANIAFLGTGLLGGAFAEAAAKRGDTVTADSTFFIIENDPASQPGI